MIFVFLFIALHITGLAQKDEGKVPLSPKINSVYQEFAPKISPDGQRLYFIRRYHPQNMGSNKNYDIWYSDKSAKGKWQTAIHLPPPVNTPLANTVEAISPDGNTLLMGLKGSTRQEANGFYFTHKKEEGWTTPSQLYIKNLNQYNKGRYMDGHLSNDGQTLLLACSDQKGSQINDIYVSFRKSNNDWTEPQSLGKQINSDQYDESTPYLASDNVTMYFSSNKPGGHGNNDIYVTRRQDSSWQNWSEPRNLGKTVNSSKWDAYFSLTAKGDSAYIVSYVQTKNKSNIKFPDNSDLFKVKIPENSGPKPVVLVKGKVLNEENEEPLQADIVYENLVDGKKEGIASSNPKSGKYQIVLPYGTNYGILAKAEGYLGIAEHLNLNAVSNYQEVHKNLYMVPLEKGSKLRLNNIFFDFGSAKLKSESRPELNRLVNIMRRNRGLKISIEGHTDSVGSKSKNLQLSKQRARAVADYLQEHNISENRFKPKGFGYAKPVATNKTEEGRQKNRRVEIRILEK